MSDEGVPASDPMLERPEPEKPGCLTPIIWFVLGALLTPVGVAAIAIAANEGEEEGVVATLISSFPLGFLWAGFWGALAFHFLTPQSKGARIGGPFGCGCLGAVVLLVMTFFFFATIFREL